MSDVGSVKKTSVGPEVFVSLMESRADIESAIMFQLEAHAGFMPLADLTRRYYRPAQRLGFVLAELLTELQSAGRIALRTNLKRKKTYVYEWDLWETLHNTAKEDNHSIEEQAEIMENGLDPLKPKLSGAARRKLERQGF